jgi:hypothetical protein
MVDFALDPERSRDLIAGDAIRQAALPLADAPIARRSPRVRRLPDGWCNLFACDVDPNESRSGEMYEFNTRVVLSLVVVGLSLAACASGPPATTVSASMGAASDAVNHARSDNALGAAPDVMNEAQQKLSQAQSAENAGENALAVRLAAEAKADADLADATAQTARAQKAAQQVNSGIGTSQPSAPQ